MSSAGRTILNNRNAARGGLIVAVALIFGGWSLHYSLGELSQPGPGLFPLLVSGILLLIGLAKLVRARTETAGALRFTCRNLLLVSGSLCGFALLSEHVNMSVGIVFLVFCSTWGTASYSWSRNLKLAAGLIVIAFAMKKLLGVNLPLY